MIADPHARADALDALLARLESSLWNDVLESGMLPAPAASTPRRARREFRMLALDAALRGLVGASGFHGETTVAVERLQSLAVIRWSRDDSGADPGSQVSERLAGYAALARQADARDEREASRQIGAACAALACAPETPVDALAELLGELHDSMREGCAEAVRTAEEA